MPGITAWFPRRPDPGDALRFKAAQQLMIQKSTDSSSLDVETERCLVGHVSYSGYPLRVWTESGFTLVFEGQIHGRSERELRRELASLSRRALAAEDALRIVSDFVRSSDGDFLIVIAAEDRCIVFGDALGRLPIYLQDTRAGLAIARECKFAAAISGAWSFDSRGLAEHFWLGYPLGSRTLFEEIERAPEGFFIDVRTGGDSIEARRAQTWILRCDVKSDARGLDACAADLADRILHATAAATKGERPMTPVVSLSGGHDSRSILACVRRARPDCIATTFRRANGAHDADVRIAEQLARALGVHWECVELPALGTPDEERLVWLKDGLNHTGMSFIPGFLEEIVRRWGESAVLLTGDGGDKIFPDLRPVRRVRSFDQLVDVVVEEHQLMPADQVEVLFDLEPGSLVEGLRARLLSYPEPDLDQKAVHWKIAERSRKWLFEGEDRNRGFLWQISPCLALSVFEAAMRVPDEHKRDFRFYAAVQRRLDPTLLDLPHADTGMSIDSARFRAHALARRWALRVMGSRRRPIVQWFRPEASAEPEAKADTLQLLELADRSGSRLMQSLIKHRSLSSVAGAMRRGVDNWRTALLLDQLWTERIPTGSLAPLTSRAARPGFVPTPRPRPRRNNARR
ncbi:MAG TPA: asparagine synthase-related protein [Planctomycetota bacterium]|nr:asparagine synthase-related protein [Planctomycetota bacterium]